MPRKDKDDIEASSINKISEKKTDGLGKENQTGKTKVGDEEVVPRCVPVFRALRVGGVLTFLAAVVLTFAWGMRGERVDSHEPVPLWIVGAILSFVWFLAAGNGKRRVVPAVIVGLGWTAVAIHQMRSWWMLIDKTSVGAARLLVWALGAFGLGIVAVFDLLLRGIRDQRGFPEGGKGDPAGIVFSRHDDDNAGLGIARRVRWVAVALVPVLVLTGATVSLRALTDPPAQSTPFSHTTAAMPEGALPELPATVGSTVAWTKDVPNLLAVTAGAAGPIILTTDGLTALRPDGTTLWTYHRQAKYEDPLISPDGRHVVLRMSIPRDGSDQGNRRHDQTEEPVYDNSTLVLDSLTGQVTSEHPAGGKGIQLTDSVVLDGDIAYELADGSQRWTLPDDFEVANSHTKSAGHASVILQRRQENSDRSKPALLLVAPDTDPSAAVEVQGIPTGDACGHSEGVVVVNGWVAQYAEAPPEEKEADGEKLVESAAMQAVTLDSLAGLETSAPIPLGRTAGVNYRASTASETLALYPEYSADEKKGSCTMISSGGSDKAWVDAVFDPASRTTTPASQYAGVAAAKVGVTIVGEGETLAGAVVVQPGNGSDGATIPIAPGSTYLSLESYGKSGPGRGGDCHHHAPVQLAARCDGLDAVFKNAPGVTVVVFDPANGTRSNYRRLYGLTGGMS
ncbi:hypothetical protein V7R84_11235 [Arachnia propionica]|uniref:hypothetical protein n=1 Tax=Arachnia propionica TaxID=1750 RepID=UPI0030D09DA6